MGRGRGRDKISWNNIGAKQLIYRGIISVEYIYRGIISVEQIYSRIISGEQIYRGIISWNMTNRMANLWRCSTQKVKCVHTNNVRTINMATGKGVSDFSLSLARPEITGRTIRFRFNYLCFYSPFHQAFYVMCERNYNTWKMKYTNRRWWKSHGDTILQ